MINPNGGMVSALKFLVQKLQNLNLIAEIQRYETMVGVLTLKELQRIKITTLLRQFLMTYFIVMHKIWILFFKLNTIKMLYTYVYIYTKLFLKFDWTAIYIF